MKRNIITLILALVAATSAQAQGLVFGTVQDAFLKTPLPEAKVSLLLAADSSVVIESIPVTAKRSDDGTVREAQFMIRPEKKTCKYLLHGTLEGYEDGYLPPPIPADAPTRSLSLNVCLSLSSVMGIISLLLLDGLSRLPDWGRVFPRQYQRIRISPSRDQTLDLKESSHPKVL